MAGITCDLEMEVFCVDVNWQNVLGTHHISVFGGLSDLIAKINWIKLF